MVECIANICKNYFPKEGTLFVSIPGYEKLDSKLRSKRSIHNESNLCPQEKNSSKYDIISNDEVKNRQDGLITVTLK